jgi:hypothetical protein
VTLGSLYLVLVFFMGNKEGNEQLLRSSYPKAVAEVEIAAVTRSRENFG